MSTIPKAFISYSHDTQEHKRWVLELATRLRNNGIDAILDQYELQPGDDIPHFMETHLASADKIIMVCTEKYVEKANKGQGGVGYEKMIVTADLLQNINQSKVIPVIRQAGGNEVPTFLKSKLFVNFSKNNDFESSYDDLVRAIHGAPLFKKPAVGNNPFQPIEKTEVSDDIKLIHHILKALLVVHYREDLNGALKNIANEAHTSYAMTDIALIKLMQLGYVKMMAGYYYLTEEGKLYAYKNGFLQ